MGLDSTSLAILPVRRGRAEPIESGPMRQHASLWARFLLCTVGLSASSTWAASESPVWGTHGMVVTSQADATLAGHEMLERGGNAVDAAVASAFALSVTQPFSSGIGGGCFLLIRIGDGDSGGDIIAIDARETAPAAATRDMYIEPDMDEHASLAGALAVATPGLVQGLVEAQERFGRLPLAVVMQPAIALAREGFGIGLYHARMIEAMRRRLLPDDPRFAETARIQFPRGGLPARPGWRLVQADLARTLELIANEGAEAYYSGATARLIATEVKALGGILTESDLASYETKQRAPVVGTYRGIEVASYPEHSRRLRSGRARTGRQRFAPRDRGGDEARLCGSRRLSR